MERRPDNRAGIRDFLIRRHAQLSPEQVGLPTSGRCRVPGLRREEAAALAEVSTEWYTRPEKGHIGGVSGDVLDAVTRTLQLDEAERTYLFDLARAAQPGPAARRRRKAIGVPPQVQWLLDPMTLSAAYVSNGRPDIVATDTLTRTLFASLFTSHTVDEQDRPDFARHYFLDDASRDFVEDWNSAANTTTALLRAKAGRYPNDKALHELASELSTVSTELRTRWAAHRTRIHHGGVKRFHHPDAGPLQLTYQPMELPMSAHDVHSLPLYTAGPGTPDEERLALLAGWAATPAGDHSLGKAVRS
jgi:hypothetical protein